jgi:hypothetical protein
MQRAKKLGRTTLIRWRSRFFPPLHVLRERDGVRVAFGLPEVLANGGEEEPSP